MAGDSIEQVEYECATLLTEFGFTEYEAKTFVYLLRLGSGTARDVADVDSVPRTRVYDAIETLHEAGLVDIQYSSPRKYTPVSRETALRKLRTQRDDTIEELSDLFSRLDPVEQRSEEFGVWTVTGREAVASRLVEFIDDAEEELIYMTVDEVLTDDHLDRLEDAADRGVDIYLAGLSEPVRERIQDRIPSVTIFETLWAWSEEGAGSLLVTDKRTALVSVLLERDATQEFDEMAIWGTGERNSLVVVLRAIFTWRLGDHARTPGSGE